MASPLQPSPPPTDEERILALLRRYRDLPLPEVARVAELDPDRALAAVKNLQASGRAQVVDRGKGVLNLTLGRFG